MSNKISKKKINNLSGMSVVSQSILSKIVYSAVGQSRLHIAYRSSCVRRRKPVKQVQLSGRSSAQINPKPASRSQQSSDAASKAVRKAVV